ncbi:hypothetical protein CM15mP5_1230 [bacterium]|nr:MAG: hypothetical protein CM15mP5_1230 [bacterium]
MHQEILIHFLTFDAFCSSTSGSNNVVIGKGPSSTSFTNFGDTQLAIGGATT